MHVCLLPRLDFALNRAANTRLIDSMTLADLWYMINIHSIPMVPVFVMSAAPTWIVTIAPQIAHGPGGLVTKEATIKISASCSLSVQQIYPPDLYTIFTLALSILCICVLLCRQQGWDTFTPKTSKQGALL